MLVFSNLYQLKEHNNVDEIYLFINKTKLHY